MITLRPYIKRGPYIILEEDNVLNSYGICNYILTKPFTDLSKITITTNLKNKVKYFKNNIKLQVFYNGNEMKKTIMVGEGNFGKVYSFQYGENSVVIKIPEKDIYVNYEVDIIKKTLPITICKNHIIPLRIIKDQVGNNFIVMQEANGDLSNLKLDLRLKFKIIIEIAKILICFMNENILYTDLKLENVLYKCKNNKLTIYLGDIGSFAKEGEILEGGYLIEEDEYPATKELVIFQFGFFIASLFGYEYTKNTKKFLKKILNDRTIPNNIKALIILFTKKSKDNDLNIVFDLIKVTN